MSRSNPPTHQPRPFVPCSKNIYKNAIPCGGIGDKIIKINLKVVGKLNVLSYILQVIN